MTYGELADDLRKLTPEQLAQEVEVVGVERPGGRVDSVWEIPEDMIDPSSDGMEPLSTYRNDFPNEDLSDEPIVAHAGTVFLSFVDESYENKPSRPSKWRELLRRALAVLEARAINPEAGDAALDDLHDELAEFFAKPI